MKKGETVESLEKVMVITFKTIARLSEANGEIRGVVRHGLGMAEKASKSKPLPGTMTACARGQV